MRSTYGLLARVRPALEYLRALPTADPNSVCAENVYDMINASAVAQVMSETNGTVKTWDLYPIKVEQAVGRTAGQDWTPDRIQRALAFFASFLHQDPESFRARLVFELDSLLEQLTRLGRKQELGAIEPVRDVGPVRRSCAGVLLTVEVDERLARYERHLHTLLSSTLRELERLQARREGKNPPPAADVNVTLNAGTD
jgi:hypothetical protein